MVAGQGGFNPPKRNLNPQTAGEVVKRFKGFNPPKRNLNYIYPVSPHYPL